MTTTIDSPAGTTLRDLVGGASYQFDADGLALEVAPYQVLWLKAM